MARMSIDDMALRDPRMKLLAKRLTAELGDDISRWPDFARRYLLGTMLDVWSVPYDRANHIVEPSDVDEAALLEGFHAELVAVGLARFDDAGLYVAGARERIEYLQKKKNSGANGGKESGRVRRENVRARTNDEALSEAQREARWNPPDSLSPLAPLSPHPRATASSEAKPSPVAKPERVGSRKRAPNSDPVPGYRELIDHFHKRYVGAYGKGPTWNSKTGAQVKRILKAHTLAEAIRRCDVLFDAPPTWLSEPYDFGTYVQHFDKLVAPSRGPRTRQQTQMDAQLDRVRALEQQASEPHPYEPGPRDECRLCGHAEDHELHDEVPW